MLLFEAHMPKSRVQWYKHVKVMLPTYMRKTQNYMYPLN